MIAILIVAIGVLRRRPVCSLDAERRRREVRGEAALLVNTLVGQMWTPTRASRVCRPSSTERRRRLNTEFAAMVAQRMPNSVPPTVVVAAGPTHQHRCPDHHPVDTPRRQRPALPAPLKYRQYQVNATIGSNRPWPCLFVRARHAARARGNDGRHPDRIVSSPSSTTSRPGRRLQARDCRRVGRPDHRPPDPAHGFRDISNGGNGIMMSPRR